MQLHQLQPKNSRTTARRIGRGGKRGKTSGHGHKGQKARAGNSMRPEMRDIIKKIPKLRGHGKNRARTVNNERVLPVAINVSVLEAAFENGATVSPQTLVAAGVVMARRKRMPAVKILGNGELTKKLSVSGCTLSASAREKIEKTGGSVS
ncbi:50S ribosomal protein L15 [Candidatus Kaiserbacteria bacterium]|nr:50S ribosomal protein L15 [Candidatus Kaiserbacteria bacterium]